MPNLNARRPGGWFGPCRFCALAFPVALAVAWSLLAVRPPVPLRDSEGRATSVLVTGASSGIGMSAATHLKRQGFHVFAGYRKDTHAERLSELGLDPVKLDVTESDDITATVRYIKDSGRRLVALVNNAGGGQKFREVRYRLG